MSDLINQYQHKIKTVEELKKEIGDFPRKKKVIMCHGVFDVVHPGHIRHMLYAKSKADILITSITADKHIYKGYDRPHVPQMLRAISLAAYEMVDYVLIDTNPTPLENISYIQPDFFAKGYEYVSDGMPLKTSEEAKTLATYGGEIIFTPGDIVYSSSQLIELAPPKLKIEKLLTLMAEEEVTFTMLKEALIKYKHLHIHVVGDTIVDSYTHSALIGGNIKTPTMSVRFEEKKDFIGGAGIVAKHIRAAGAKVLLTTVLGDDELKNFVLSNLGDIEIQPIIDSTRPTTNKNVIVANNYRLLKIDTLENSSISDHILYLISNTIRNAPSNAVIFSDFRHGIFNRRTIPELYAAIPRGTYRVADSQVASRWGNIIDFQDFDLITPNEREARFALADQDTGIRSLAANLYDKAHCKTLILKLGDRGLLTCRNNQHEALDSFFVIDSFVERIVDTVGAGDALLAYSTLTMLATGSEVMASIIGSFAAACECECDGNIPITIEQILEKIKMIEKQAYYDLSRTERIDKCVSLSSA
ncbi:MAG: hypothetical protein ACD_46C00347G0002 [uncultured bacterium]|nr:MAG: hypothetical protein ACD_46C00347G0002 [uncultured bacterium]HLB42526.1 PfkB family carbohydrate kinase [Gammaproteobacteria bacterium]